MAAWEWETFENILNDAFYSITDVGPLFHPIKKFSFERDDDLNIILSTIADDGATSNSVSMQPGTVAINTDVIEFTSIVGSKAVAKGIQRVSYTKYEADESGNKVVREKVRVLSVEIKYSEPENDHYTIEWIANVSDSYLIWPDSIDTNTTKETKRVLSSHGNKLELHSSEDAGSYNRKCLNIAVGGFNLYVGSSSPSKDKDCIKPGFIIYDRPVPEETRRKIRNCLSYALGMHLVYLGHTTFSKDWRTVTTKAITAYSLDKKAFKLCELLPAPLSDRSYNEVMPNVISHMVNALYDHYDEYKFGHISWLYWHALCAPVHSAAVQFGAAIESLQGYYIKNNERTFRSALIERSKWKALRPALLGALKSAALDSQESSVITNKINSLNQAPQSILTERFFLSIGIQFGELEMTAWQQRNSAAHGGEIEEGGEIKLIKEINILKTLFNRLVLRVFNASENYFDYYSLGLPIRKIQDAIPKDQ